MTVNNIHPEGGCVRYYKLFVIIVYERMREEGPARPGRRCAVVAAFPHHEVLTELRVSQQTVSSVTDFSRAAPMTLKAKTRSGGGGGSPAYVQARTCGTLIRF